MKLKYVIFTILLQLINENIVQKIMGDNYVRLSLSFIFILNWILAIKIKNEKVFYIIQTCSFAIYIFSLLPHLYYFNIFSFYPRFGYIFQNISIVIMPALLIFISLLLIYFYSKLQFNIIQKIEGQNKIALVIIFSIIILKYIINPIQINNFYISIINQNRISEIVSDYNKFIQSSNKINNYNCEKMNDSSASIKYFYKSNKKRELLLILESWGELKNLKSNEILKSNIINIFQQNNDKSLRYHDIVLSNCCFNGNTAAAEGRELLNVNDEESYRGIINNGINPKLNLIELKKKNGYHTISGFSSSKKYGSNWSNAEGFRKFLGFQSRIYYEELKEKYQRNNENDYISVSDEDMIESIVELSQKYEKVFVYGLTINTHTPFKLDFKKILTSDYEKNKNNLLHLFSENLNAFNQYYRILKTIEYVFKKINQSDKGFDEIIIIGDHPSPDINFGKLYKQEDVPYIHLYNNK